MLVENDDLIRDLVVVWLSEAGYVVRPAVEVAAQPDDPPNLIVTGLTGPIRQELVSIESMRAAYPGVPILLVSGWFRAGLHGCCATARQLGVSGVLSIPFSRSELLSAVAEAIGSVS